MILFTFHVTRFPYQQILQRGYKKSTSKAEFQIHSCSKQDQAEPAGSATEIYQSEADILIENKIKAFKGKMEYLRKNPSYKSSETMSVDSAVWYMEAASNQTYADGASAFSKSVLNTFSIVIDATNGEVLLSDIAEAYDDMIESLSATYHALPGENNHLVVNDVSLTSMDESSIKLGVNSVFGESTDGTSNIFTYEWYWGLLMGRGDGAFIGESDAAEEIEKMIHQRKGTLPPNSYYTDVDTVYVEAEDFINPNDPIPNDNMYDFLMFRNLDNGFLPNVHALHTVEEMNFYLLGTEYVIYTLEPDGLKPNGKNFVSADLVGDLFYGPNYESLRFHIGWVQYGVLHTNSQPPSDLQFDKCLWESESTIKYCGNSLSSIF